MGLKNEKNNEGLLLRAQARAQGVKTRVKSNPKMGGQTPGVSWKTGKQSNSRVSQ